MSKRTENMKRNNRRIRMIYADECFRGVHGWQQQHLAKQYRKSRRGLRDSRAEGERLGSRIKFL
jgi:hypothetical protein